ncbi:serine/threonine-protein kinase pim-2-like [Clarias gariepinus]
MDCDRKGRKERHTERKMMNLAYEEPEVQPKKKLAKRRGKSKEEQKVKTEKTETISSVTKKGRKGNLKRKRLDVHHKEPEPQPKEKANKRRRTEKKEKTENAENIFSRYVLDGMLGGGSFGAVYPGVRKSDGKKVVVKFTPKRPNEQYITLPGDIHSLPLEVALMEIVCKPPQCPFVIELVEWCETPSFIILVLERPDPCVDLFKYQQTVNMSESLARTIMRQVIQAARHCRDRGVFHQDINSKNILVNPQTIEVKLIDFGCGDLLKDTPYKEFNGTKIFRPPELFVEGEYKAKPATVWGLGLLLYNLLCGRDVFCRVKEIVEGHMDFPDHLSEASCSLLKWCLQQDPKKRPTLEQILSHHWFTL